MINDNPEDNNPEDNFEELLDLDLDLDAYASDNTINSTSDLSHNSLEDESNTTIDFDEELDDASSHNQKLEINSFKEFVAKENIVPEKENTISQALNEISFTIKCEIGHVEIALNDLLNLKIGDCLEFMRWPGKVKLKLNDYLFAEGYLIEQEGMLGVKISNNLGVLNSFLMEKKVTEE